MQTFIPMSMQKPLAPDNDYLIRYSNSIGPKGDTALIALSKSEENDPEESIVWHPIQPKMLPWRGVDIKTSNGVFTACCALEWWTPKNQKIFLPKLTSMQSIETNPITVYLWKP